MNILKNILLFTMSGMLAFPGICSADHDSLSSRSSFFSAEFLASDWTSDMSSSLHSEYDTSSSSDNISITEQINDKLACENVITALDITPAGFVIDRPGQWCLAEDVQYSPIYGNPAITIAASNVTLDLNSKTITQVSNQPFIIGVVVGANTTNVCVKNGTLKNFSQAGVFVNPFAALPIVVKMPPVVATKFPKAKVARKTIKSAFAKSLFTMAQVQTKVQGQVEPGTSQATVVQIANIQAINNGQANFPFAGINGMGGIVVFSASDVLVTDCTCTGNFFSGISGVDVVKFSMQNCHADDTQSSLLAEDGAQFAIGGFFGGSMTGARDISIKNCSFNKSTGSGTSVGLFINNFNDQAPTIVNVAIENVEANDAQTLSEAALSGANAAGIVVVNAENVAIQNAQTNNTNIEVNALGVDQVVAAGIFIQANGCLVTNCQSLDTSINALQPVNVLQNIGLAITGKNFVCADCECGSQVTTSQGQVATLQLTAAIHVADSAQGVLRNCECNNLSSFATTPGLSVVEGIFIRTSSDVIVENCVASSIGQSATNPTGQFSIAAGFGASLSNRIVFRKCQATYAYDENNALAYGFTTREPLTPGQPSYEIVFDSCIAEGSIAVGGNGGGFDVRTLNSSKVLACVADRNTMGIFVSEDFSGGCSNNIISGNTLLANQQVGIYDISTSKSNAYYTNRAESNGPTPSSTNYLGDVFPEAMCYDADSQRGSSSSSDRYDECQSANKTPIRRWQLPFAPCKQNTNCQKHEILDNLSIFR